MLRIIGILTGAALAVAILMFALGMPEFSRPGTEVEPLAIEPPSAAPPENEAIAQDAPEPAKPADSELLTEPAAPAPHGAEPDPDLGFGGWRPGPELIDSPHEQAQTAAVIPEPVEEHWYAFWSPFRSEIAANGFVMRLQETTGLDYRVVKVKTGVYEVAFAYNDDADIEEKLARISSATGLDMSGG